MLNSLWIHLYKTLFTTGVGGDRRILCVDFGSDDRHGSSSGVNQILICHDAHTYRHAPQPQRHLLVSSYSASTPPLNGCDLH